MTRPLLFATLAGAALLAAPSASAAARRYTIGNYDRVRVDGPFDVRLSTETPPSAIADGDPQATDGLDIRVEGTTLIIRPGVSGWGERPVVGSADAPVIRLTTRDVRSAVVIGGGRLDIAGRLRGQRVDLQLTGSGALAVPALDVDQLNVTLLGSGSIALGGRAARVRLSTSGSGAIDAVPLVSGDLIVRLDGPGTTRATAKFTADVTTLGIGAATIHGKPACTVKAVAGGPISCGRLATP